MEKTLKPLVDSLINLIQNGVDFVKGQIPDVAQQILHFKAAEAWLDLVFPWLVVGALVLAVKFFIARFRASERYGNEGWLVCLVVSSIALAIAIVVGFCASYDSIVTLIKINYAPKVFLLEYLKALLSTPK